MPGMHMLVGDAALRQARLRRPRVRRSWAPLRRLGQPLRLALDPWAYRKTR